MAFPLLGEIERLIDEHGSAKILSERIALAKDQYVAIEKELSASKRIETASKARTVSGSSLEKGKTFQGLPSQVF